jgi:hypothetical protein
MQGITIHLITHCLQIEGDCSLSAEFLEIAKKKNTHCSISCDCHLFQSQVPHFTLQTNLAD